MHMDPLVFSPLHLSIHALWLVNERARTHKTLSLPVLACKDLLDALTDIADLLCIVSETYA